MPKVAPILGRQRILHRGCSSHESSPEQNILCDPPSSEVSSTVVAEWVVRDRVATAGIVEIGTLCKQSVGHDRLVPIEDYVDECVTFVSLPVVSVCFLLT